MIGVTYRQSNTYMMSFQDSCPIIQKATGGSILIVQIFVLPT